MKTEDKDVALTNQRDRLRNTSLTFVVATLPLAVFALAARLSAQNPQPLPPTVITQTVNFTQGQEAKVKGLIISRNGDDVIIRDEDAKIDVVSLTADTKISSPSGLFKMDKKARDVTNLLPGLIVEVKGNGGDRGNLLADKISFHSSALRVAEQIAAGTVALSMRVGANTDSINALKGRTTDSLEALKARITDSLEAITARARDSLARINARFDDIDRYDTRDSATVNFRTGSAMLSDEGKRALDALAASAVTQDGYLVEVRGYADAVGRSTANLELSERRAEAVVAYLVNDKGVPLRRLLNPTGFGETEPVASNDTRSGRAMNRRAEIKVIVNRAIKRS